MHELTLAQEIIRIIKNEQRRHGFHKVNLVKLKAGPFSGIDQHALSFAFDVIKEGTCAAQARIDLDLEPAKFVCRQCGFADSARNVSSSCPRCRSIDIALEGTCGFEVAALEVD